MQKDIDAFASARQRTISPEAALPLGHFLASKSVTGSVRFVPSQALTQGDRGNDRDRAGQGRQVGVAADQDDGGGCERQLDEDGILANPAGNRHGRRWMW